MSTIKYMSKYWFFYFTRRTDVRHGNASNVAIDVVLPARRPFASSFRDGIAYSGPVRRVGNAAGDRRKHIAGVPRAVSCGRRGRGSSLGRPAS